MPSDEDASKGKEKEKKETEKVEKHLKAERKGLDKIREKIAKKKKEGRYMAGVMSGLFTIVAILAGYWTLIRMTEILCRHQYQRMMLRHQQLIEKTEQFNEHSLAMSKQSHEVSARKAVGGAGTERLTIRFARLIENENRYDPSR